MLRILIYIYILIFFQSNLLSQKLDWGYVFGNTSSDYAFGVCVDSEDNVTFAGVISGDTDFDRSSGTHILNAPNGSDAYIAQYDKNGNIRWAYTFDSPSSNTIFDVEKDSKDNLYVLVTGNDLDLDFSSNLLLATGTFLVKYDKNGNYISHQTNIVYTGGEKIYLHIDKSNNIYVFGCFSSSFDIDPSAAVQMLTHSGLYDFYVSKYNSNLVFQRAFSIGDSGQDQIRSLETDNLGNIYIVGSFEQTVDFNPSASTYNLTAIDDKDGFLAKYDKDFNFVFAKIFSGTSFQRIYDVKLLNDELILTGNFYSDIDADPDAASLVFNIAGGGSGADIFFGKYKASNGELIYAKHLEGGGIFESLGNRLLIDEWGFIYLGGVIWGTVDFDPSASDYIINSSLYNIFHAKYDNDGNFIWTGIMDGGEIDALSQMQFNSKYELIASGNVRVNQVDLDISSSAYYQTPVGNEDILITQTTQPVFPRIKYDSSSALNNLAFSPYAHIQYDGNASISEVGFLISETPNPNFSNYDFKIIASESNFTGTFSNLFSGTKYYFCAFATNSFGTAFSEIKEITTPPSEEDLAPNSGDGNGDGIRDSRQSYVYSFKSPINSKYITITDLNQNVIYAVSFFTGLGADGKYYYPYGRFGFKIDAVETRVKIHFHGLSSIFNYEYRKLHSNNVFYEFEARERGIDTIASKETAYFILELTDGEFGDYDGIVNGTIFDPGGPAIILTIANVPYWDEFYKYLFVIILVLVGLIYIKRLC